MAQQGDVTLGLNWPALNTELSTDLATWQQIYTKRPAHLARGFAIHFLTYATGAPPRFSDEAALDAIAKKATNVRSIIREVILSDIFQTK